jgi:carbamoylphosphate synthase large subunit
VVGTYAAFEAVLPFEAELRELAGLPTTDPDTVLAVLDKTVVRRKLYAEGLSVLRSATLDEALGWDIWPYKGEAVLKPANGTGSALCFIVGSLEELRAAAEEVRAGEVVNPLMREYIVAHGEFLLEEKAEGELLSVESLIDRGEVHVMGSLARYVMAANPVIEQSTHFPYRHPRYDELVAKSTAIHHSLGIHHGYSHVEFMVPDDGPIELVDFNARFAGVDNVIVLSHAFGVPFEKCLCDIACGVRPDLSFLDRPQRYAANSFVMPPPDADVVFEGLEFPPEVVFWRYMKELGKPLSGGSHQLDALGTVVVAADSAAEVHDLLLDVRRRIRFNGEPLGDNPNNIQAFSRHLGSPMTATTTTIEGM